MIKTGRKLGKNLGKVWLKCVKNDLKYEKKGDEKRNKYIENHEEMLKND